MLSGLHGWIDDPERMAAASEEALAIYRDLDDPAGVAVAIGSIGWAQLQMGRLEPARSQPHRGHRPPPSPSATAERAAAAMPALGIIAQFEGDLGEARRRFQAAPRTRCGGRRRVHGGDDRVHDRRRRQASKGTSEAAEQRYDAGLSGYLRIGNVMGVSWGLYSFADLALQSGQPSRALRLVGASDRLRGGTELPALITTTLGDVGGRARERLEDGAADELYRRGHDMSMEAAVAYARDHALADDPPEGRVQM